MTKPKLYAANLHIDEFLMRSGDIMYEVAQRTVPDLYNAVYHRMVDPFDSLDNTVTPLHPINVPGDGMCWAISRRYVPG